MALNWQRASLMRQLLAMVYDSLLLMALWLVVGGVAVSLNGGEAPNNPLVRYGVLFPSLVGITWLVYAGVWRKGGQTLGMRAWKIRVMRSDGQPMTWQAGLIRCVFGSLSWLMAGLGYAYALVNANRDTFHDLFSKTCVIRTHADGAPL